MSETNGTRKPKNSDPESSKRAAPIDPQGDAHKNAEYDGEWLEEGEELSYDEDKAEDKKARKAKKRTPTSEMLGEEYSMPSSEITMAEISPHIKPVPELASLTEEEWAPPEDTLDDFDPEPEQAPLDVDWMLAELEHKENSGHEVSNKEAMQLAMKVAGLEEPPSVEDSSEFDGTDEEESGADLDELSEMLAAGDTQPFDTPREETEEKAPENGEDDESEEEDVGSVDLDQLSMMLDDEIDYLEGENEKERESQEEEDEDDSDVVDLMNEPSQPVAESEEEAQEEDENDSDVVDLLNEPSQPVAESKEDEKEDEEEGIDLASLAAELGLDDPENIPTDESEAPTEEATPTTAPSVPEIGANVVETPAVIALGPVEGMDIAPEATEEDSETSEDSTSEEADEEPEEEMTSSEEEGDVDSEETSGDSEEETEAEEEEKAPKTKSIGGMSDKEYLPSIGEDGVAVWKPKYVPIPDIDIPMKVKKKLDAEEPRRLLLARNLVPMSSYEMGYTLYCLMNDESEAVRKAATRSLTEMPASIMRPIAEQKLPPQILDWIARNWFSETDPDRIIETIVFNSAVGDHTLEALVTICSETILDIISRNQVRMQNSPQLIFLFPYNPNTTIGLLNRVLEFARRQRLINDEEEERLIQRFENRDNPDWEADIDPDSPAARLKEAVPETHTEDGTLDWEFPGFMTDDFDSILDLDADAEIIDDKIKQKKDMRELIREMSVPQKLRLAVRGNMEARKILIEDRLQLVAVAVLKSPRITRTEIERAAESKTVQPEVIWAIAKDASAMRNYQIRWALVQNPKTPIQIATQVMGTLREKEVKTLSKSKAVPHAVSTIARQKREIAEQRAKRRQKKKK